MAALFILLMLASNAEDRTLRLADGAEMAYVDRGKGSPAIVLVHCGNCRKEIWKETLDAFAGEHRVVAMDLPGYGRSPAGARTTASIPALGADVAALVKHLKLEKVVLVGNSLGGPVALEAAHLLGPKRVLGVVAVDTLQDVEAVWPEESWRKVLEAYEADFVKMCDQLMLGLLPKDAPEATRQRVDDETCSNDPKVAIALHRTFRSYEASRALREAGVPVWAINSTQRATAVDANRKYSPTFQVILMDGVGHYPQVEKPAEFQAHLLFVVRALQQGPR
ncbi:MAG TPA: alpha/beta hydrolase [Vicinamibacteria bacterium]